MITVTKPNQLSLVQRRSLLKQKYFEMPRAKKLDECLSSLVDDYDAGVLTGLHFEGCGAVVVGESNSGKTREINQAIMRLNEQDRVLECGREVRCIQLALVGETTWKALGLFVIEKLGYPMSARRSEHEIWSRVRMRLEASGTWLIHIDECQHMFQTLGVNETKKVINSLKTFMKHRDWPIAVVLSGIPELLDKVNLDAQFRNLMTPFAMSPLDPLSNDLHEVDTAFYLFAEAVGINIDEVRNEDTYLRICHGHANLYGRIFRFMIDAFSTLPLGQTKMTIEHLADRYALKTGCMPGHNVFFREDFRECDSERLWAGAE